MKPTRNKHRKKHQKGKRKVVELRINIKGDKSWFGHVDW
jgi:hypothetical protein